MDPTAPPRTWTALYPGKCSHCGVDLRSRFWGIEVGALAKARYCTESCAEKDLINWVRSEGRHTTATKKGK